MPSASNAAWRLEAGGIKTDMELLTNTGDNTVFKGSKTYWSSAKNRAPVVRSDGIRNGLAVTPKSGTNDAVTVASGQINLVGVIVNIAGADVSTGFSRPSGTGGMDSLKNAVTYNGTALVVVAGTEGTAFSNTRGAAGGPPFIPVGSVEIAQVWLTGTAAAQIQAAEIFQVPGEHQERADLPRMEIQNFEGHIKYLSALPLIHTGSLPRRTYAETYDPVFLEIPSANNLQPPELSVTVNSTTVYKTALGAAASSLSAGSATVLVENGVRDSIVAASKDGLLWHKFYPDDSQTDHLAGQAHVGIVRTYPADNLISVAVTLAAEKPWVEVQ